MARSWLALSETIDVNSTPYQAPADIGRMVVRVIRCQRLSQLDYSSVRENSIASECYSYSGKSIARPHLMVCALIFSQESGHSPLRVWN